MPIYKPSELLHFLEDLKLIPKKGLSQNFLIDGNIIKKIIATAQVKPDDLVLEIGPGPGSLTEGLLYSGANVIAVEKDAILAKALERFDPLQNQLKVFCADILDFPIVEVLKNHLKRGQRAKIIANLPYHITTPIIGSLVHLNEFVSSITVMVQDEVARRFTAIPGNKEYGSFTLFLNFFSEPYYAFQVSKNCFYPVPKVHSAVVLLNLKPPPRVSQEKFFTLTRTAFKQRRKMMRASLKALFTPVEISRALEAIHCSLEARPEELSLKQFLLLFEELSEKKE